MNIPLGISSESAKTKSDSHDKVRTGQLASLVPYSEFFLGNFMHCDAAVHRCSLRTHHPYRFCVSDAHNCRSPYLFLVIKAGALIFREGVV